MAVERAAEDSGGAAAPLQTPQIHAFKHENVFSLSFREAEEPAATPGRLLSSPQLPVHANETVVEAAVPNSAPKKNILFRTISQVEMDGNAVIKSQPIIVQLTPPLQPATKVAFAIQDTSVLKRLFTEQKSSEAEEDPPAAKRTSFTFTAEDNSDAASSPSSPVDDLVSSSGDKPPRARRSMQSNSDQRKQQIRSSNREAARRCRERKRSYIETLEAKIAQLEENISGMDAKEARNAMENASLRSELANLRVGAQDLLS